MGLGGGRMVEYFPTYFVNPFPWYAYQLHNEDVFRSMGMIHSVSFQGRSMVNNYIRINGRDHPMLEPPSYVTAGVTHYFNKFFTIYKQAKDLQIHLVLAPGAGLKCYLACEIVFEPLKETKCTQTQLS